MNQTDQQVLQKVVVATAIALTTLECIAPHAQGELKEKLTLFSIEHRELQQSAEKILHDHQIKLSHPNKFVQSFAITLTNRRLANHNSPSYIAQMIIKGTASGSNNLNSFLKNHKDANSEYLHLAKDLLELQSRMQTALVCFI